MSERSRRGAHRRPQPAASLTVLSYRQERVVNASGRQITSADTIDDQMAGMSFREALARAVERTDPPPTKKKRWWRRGAGGRINA